MPEWTGVLKVGIRTSPFIHQWVDVCVFGSGVVGVGVGSVIDVLGAARDTL